MVRLSIVVPYYNCYEYACTLLDRLVPQLNDETEVILVDDGCNEERLDRYNSKLVKILHQKENKGAGTTYNVGIDEAQGQYIAFIDADDFTSTDYVEVLLNAIKTNPTELIYMDWQDTFTQEVITKPDNYAPWKAIYKKDIIPKFPTDIKFHFDVPFYDKLKERGFTKSYVDKLLYFYNSKRPGNLSDIKEKMIKEGLL